MHSLVYADNDDISLYIFQQLGILSIFIFFTATPKNDCLIWFKICSYDLWTEKMFWYLLPFPRNTFLKSTAPVFVVLCYVLVQHANHLSFFLMSHFGYKSSQVTSSIFV